MPHSSDDLPPRLRAACDLAVVEVREAAGRHEYDGVLQDLSPDAVGAGLARLGQGADPEDGFDAARLRAAEVALRVQLGVVEDHRRNPMWHLAGLDLASYDREYAPAADRAAARRRHVEAWPAAVDVAVSTLDRVPAPVAAALLSPARGLAAGLLEGPAAAGLHEATGGSDAVDAALAAHGRLVKHLERAEREGSPDVAYGAEHLALLLGAPEALEVDLAALAATADAERDRLRGILAQACERLEPGVGPAELVPRLLADHPSEPEQIYAEAREQIEEASAFTLSRQLLPDYGGECLVGPAPASRRWAMAMMSWAAPYEPDAPSWYHVTPPDEAWSPEAREEWLSIFSRTTLPGITVHEVTPGHFAHGRALRGLQSDVRRLFYSTAFIEGWAHYVEELFVEEGFRAADPRFVIGMCIEALIRVTRLAVSVGVHTGAFDVEEGARRFEADAFQRGPAARLEAVRATFDPTYGRYTWGKLAIQQVRERARQQWGEGYSHLRLHQALLGLGAPPLGLLDEALHVG